MERKFSINSIALGNLRRRRGRYMLLVTGIVLAIYFVAAALLFADTMFTSLREQHYDRLGEQDAIVFDCGEAPLEELISTGIFSEYGTADILSYVLPDGQNRENGFSIARFDQAALTLARKEPLEGRLPEKAGEIALEQSALARLRTAAGVGDTITLTLLLPDGSGFMDAPVQKSYTLVGILTDKLVFLDRLGYLIPAYHDYPAGVLSAEEQIETGGRAVVNCYGRCAEDAASSFKRLAVFCEEYGITSGGWPVDNTTFQLFNSDHSADDSSIVTTSVFFTIIALVLVCAACLGIVNAFSADLASRRRQIGLFRAVGTTQKQIRAIFGREVILIAFFSVPSGLALAGLTVWGITAVLGDSYIFRPNLLIILAVAAAGVICVRLAAAIPLRKAARIPPMQAIRGVELTRRLKRSRMESRTLFDVPRHIARRSMTLYRNKQLGFAAMLAVSIVLLSLIVFVAKPILGESGWDYGCDYVLLNQERIYDWLMEYGIHRPGITEQDKADAAFLATVKTVTGEKILSVKLLAEKVTPYIIDSGCDRFEYLSPEPRSMVVDHGTKHWMMQEHQDYLASKAKYGYDQDYLTLECCGTDAQIIEKLLPFVSAGRINIEKLNSGEEILIIAPTRYGLIREEWDDGSRTTYTHYQLDPGAGYSAIYQNDMFRAGDTVNVSLLYSDGPLPPGGPWQYNVDGSRILPVDAVRVDRTVTIGALLEPQAGRQYLSSYFHSPFYLEVGDIITTTAGLQAMGFEVPYIALAVTLSESPDAAMEEYLETNLAQIAARTSGVDLRSYIALVREGKEKAYGILIAASAVLLLFFAICASMVNNAFSARIRADRREIGTLRAVGASERVIARSYLWQLLSTFTWGTIAGLAVELALCGWLLWKQIASSDTYSLPLWPPLLFVALLFGICHLNVRSKVGGIFRSSIVENIREL